MAEKERYLRKIENQKDYHSAVRRLTRSVERCIQQNNAIDMYEAYFDEDEFDSATEPPSAKTISVFRDPNETKRSATYLCWNPDGSNKVAVAYSQLQFQKMPSNMPVSSYIWDVNSPNEPDMEIIPNSPLSCLVYNPRTPDHIVGGSYNGLISFWDLRKGSHSLDTSAIEKSHRDPVHDIHWIQSRTGNECVSASTDGQLLWWDVRKLSEGPTDTMILNADSGDYIHGISCMDYRTDAGPTRYLAGTDQGQIVLVDRKAKKDAESTKSIKNEYGNESGSHHGPCYSLSRHPFNPKYFMSVGDWTTRIWMEDLKTPLITTRYDNAYLTGGCWSPTRPGVFYSTKVNGTLDVWDLYHKHSDPVFSTKVGDTPITSIRVHGKGSLVAIGSEDGTTTILEMGSPLVDMQSNEKQAITHMLERETKREKNLEIRNNLKKREKQNADKKSKSNAAPVSSKDDARAAEAIKKAEEDFFALINSASETPAATETSEEDQSSAAKSEPVPEQKDPEEAKVAN